MTQPRTDGQGRADRRAGDSGAADHGAGDSGAAHGAAASPSQRAARDAARGGAAPTPPPDTAQAVRQTVRSLHLGEPMVDGALCILPFRSTLRTQSRYVLLQQAIERGTMTITEVSDAGSVPHLLAVNKGPWPVLIFDGEELVGAKQNRIANATVLVGVGKTVLPVSCVEAGRWSHRTASFDDGSYASHPRLRMEKERQVYACMVAEEHLRDAAQATRRAPGAPPHRAQAAPADEPQAVRAMRYRSDQSAVWAEVSRTQDEMGVRSPTSALTDTFEAGRDKLEQMLHSLAFQPHPADDGLHHVHHAVGVAVFLGGQFVCLDLLRPGRRFELLYAKLLRGYALEALLRKSRAPKGFDPEAATLRLFAELLEAGLTEHAAADLGTDLRLEGGQITGSGLVWQDELIQLSLFPRVVV
jgi:hypothetical protein